MRRSIFFGDNSGGIKIHLPPIADQALGTWSPSSGGTLFGVLADGLRTTWVATSTPSVFIEKVMPATLPARAGHVLRFGGNSSSGASFKLSLYDGDPNSGGTLIAEMTKALAGEADYAYELSSGEAAAINAASYYGNLYLRGEAL